MCRSLALALVVVTLAAAGCQQNNEKTEANLEAKICDNLASVGSALDKVAALEPTSTVGEAKVANLALSTSLASLNQSETLLEKLRLQEFRDQLKTFDTAATRVTSNKTLTLEEAASELKTEAAPVIAARRRVSEQVNCPAEATAIPTEPSPESGNGN